MFGSLAILGMFALVRAAGGEPVDGARRGRADGARQPAARPRADRDARHLRARGDGLGSRAVPARPTAVRGVVLGDRRLHEARGAIRAARARRCSRRSGAWARGERLAARVPSGGRASSRGGRRSRCSSRCSRCSDRIAPPYDERPAQARRRRRSATSGTCSATRPSQTSPHGPQGIASYPWEWLVDYKPIVVPEHQPGAPGRGLRRRSTRRSTSSGMISPPILLARRAGAGAGGVGRVARLGAPRSPARGTAGEPESGCRCWRSRGSSGRGSRSCCSACCSTADELPLLHGDRDARACTLAAAWLAVARSRRTAG